MVVGLNGTGIASVMKYMKVKVLRAWEEQSISDNNSAILIMMIMMISQGDNKSMMVFVSGLLTAF